MFYFEGIRIWDVGTVTFYSQTKVVIHELMHAIGQMHEQQRSDRDEYIEILYDNVPSDQRHNFDKENTHDRTPYDVESILQYPLTVSLGY